MSNNIDGALILDTAGAAGDYIGFGRTAKTAVSTNARIRNAANLAALSGVITDPAGSIALCDDGTVAINTDGATAWTQFGATVATITDPGDAAAIPVTSSGVVNLVSAGAETRTLAIPTFIGQTLTLGFGTDGGDCVVTAASGVNQTGNNTLTFADAGDHLKLEAILLAAALVWRIVANDGVALSTV